MKKKTKKKIISRTFTSLVFVFAIIGMITTTFGGEETDRHVFLKWLTGEESTKKIEGKYIQAILEWMKPSKPDQDSAYIPEEAAIAEAKLGLREAHKELGQAEFPMEEEK